jgi:hypothetical protein
LVPNERYSKHNTGRLQERIIVVIKATSYFDFLTNNDDTRAIYWGGMSTYNFRKYSDPDETFATFLNDSRTKLGIPEGVYFVPGN